MRIVLLGQQAFGKSVLEALVAHGEEVVAVYCAPDGGERLDPLKEAALARDLPVFQPKSYCNGEVQAEFAALNADLCVMAYVTLLVPEEVLYTPRFGTIQYHPSLLPRHRGPSAINWAIISGAEKTGLTIFWPDNGLDTGPILLQEDVTIKDSDTVGSLYFEQLFPRGVAALAKAVDMVRDGTAPKIRQDESRHTYEGWCRKEDVEIDWSKPVQEVWNLIRGADPQPGAWSRCNGEDVHVYDARKHVGESGARPGEVTAVGGDSFTVAVAGGAIEIRRVRPAGGRKVAAEEFIAGNGLQPGTRFGR